MPAPTLIIFSGRTGVGKTAIACALACQIHATDLRIDAIEQALRDSGAAPADLERRRFSQIRPMAPRPFRARHRNPLRRRKRKPNRQTAGGCKITTAS